MNVKLITAVAVVLQAAALGALAQDTTRPGGATSSDHTMHDKSKDKSAMSVDSKTFVEKAANADMEEIQLGQLALQKSQDPDIKQFAERMVKDHTASSTKLKAAAAKANVTVPSTLDSEHQKSVQKLQALSGAEFDKEYRKTMEKGHGKAVALFESASQSTKVDESLRQFAANTLPTIKTHHELADDLDEATAARQPKTDRDRSTVEDR